MKQSPKRHLPSLVTALNLFAGFLSVVHSIREDYETAAWLIVVAAVMDVLDGKVARLVKSSSEFGVELDSLADISSFGFAPAVLIYKSYFFSWGFIGIFLSFLPLVFGGIRLARFNTQVTDVSEKDPFFKGLPIPSSAITLAAFVVFEHSTFGGSHHTEVLAGLTVLVSLLLISRIRYDAMPNFSFKKNQDKLKIIFLIILLPLFAVFPSQIILPCMLLFILSGIVRSLIDHFRHEESDDEISDIPAVE